MPISSFKYENMFTKAMLCGLELYSHWVPLVEVLFTGKFESSIENVASVHYCLYSRFFRSSSRSIPTMAVLRA